MEVIVYHGQERRPFSDVSGIVISEIRQHLDLYQRYAPVIRLEPEEWTRLEVDRERAQEPEPEQERERPARRGLALR